MRAIICRLDQQTGWTDDSCSSWGFPQWWCKGSGVCFATLNE